MPDEGDFPTEAGPLGDPEWLRLRTLLAERHAALAEAIATFDDAMLPEEMGTDRDAPLGTGVSYYAMLHGLIQHDAYHAGQIMLLRKALD